MEVCHEAAPRVYNGFVVFDDWLEGQLAELEEMCERITGYRLEAVENVDGWVRRIPLPKPSSSTDSPPEEGTSTGSCVSPQGSGFPHDHVSVTTPDFHPFSSISSTGVPFSGMVPPKLSENPPIPPASGSGSFGSSMKRKLEDVYSDHELNDIVPNPKKANTSRKKRVEDKFNCRWGGDCSHVFSPFDTNAVLLDHLKASHSVVCHDANDKRKLVSAPCTCRWTGCKLKRQLAGHHNLWTHITTTTGHVLRKDD